MVLFKDAAQDWLQKEFPLLDFAACDFLRIIDLSHHVHFVVIHDVFILYCFEHSLLQNLIC